MQVTALILVVLVWKIVGENPLGERLEVDRLNGGIPERIAGGSTMSIERAPYYVQVSIAQRYFCGGSILTEIVILTAGHCIENNASYFVIAGSDRFFRGTKLNVENVVKHPNYGHPKLNIYFDVALIFLTEKLIYSTTIQPIVIPNAETPLVPAGAQLLIVGLGFLNITTYATRLQGIYVPMMSEKDCLYNLKKRTNNSTILATQFCAGNLSLANYGTCKGDSGGPAIYNGVQYGVVSFGSGCGKIGAPKILANLVTLNIWIRQIIKDLSFKRASSLV